MIEKLYELAGNFRQAIEQAVHDGRLTITPFTAYPRGCCDMGSELLAQYLLDNQIVTMMINGKTEKDNSHHVWLRTDDGITIDITADQFNGQIGMPSYSAPIIIGDEAPIHDVFSDERYSEEPLCKERPIYQVKSCPNRRERDLYEAYNILRDYLGFIQ
jgi:hypothetical protein